jgi:hypothetical protein
MTITTWFTAVVEDVSDPTGSGRVRIRCLGFHNSDKAELPTEDLPWATCLLPVTSASSHGVGTSATGLVPGSWVFGFFRDGSEMQDPVVLSTIASSSDASGYDNGLQAFSGVGFVDPYGSAAALSSGYDIPAGAASGSQVGGVSSLGSVGIYGGGSLSSLENPPPPPNVAGGTREKMVAIAKSRVGNTYETSVNQGPGIAELWTATNYPGGYNARAPWCAAFTSWCVQQAGTLPENVRPKSAAAFKGGGYESWASQNPSVARLIRNPKTINTGDLVIFSFSHIGIASSNSDSNGYFTCVEGNTNSAGSREGNGVYEKRRNIKLVRSVASLIV